MRDNIFLEASSNWAVRVSAISSRLDIFDYQCKRKYLNIIDNESDIIDIESDNIDNESDIIDIESDCAIILASFDSDNNVYSYFEVAWLFIAIVYV